MVYVNQNQLDQVQYLIEQSILGNHILFNNETIIRIAIGNAKDLERNRMEKAERLIEEMILCPTLDAKRCFLAKLDHDTHDDVARVYLNIVHNRVYESSTFLQ